MENMLKMRWSLSIILVALFLMLLVPTSVAAQEVPQLPALYWGTVRIISPTGQFNIPPGTTITVQVDGVERGSIRVNEPGKYGGPSGLDAKLTLQGDILQGSSVEFYIGGVKADQTTYFRNDQPQQINLTVHIVLGDANLDGNVNAVDITKVERIIAQLDAIRLCADANVDGDVNAIDITKVERIIAGLD
ncbi:hypothetical protein ES703_08137 [subsurface metagenome]